MKELLRRRGAESVRLAVVRVACVEDCRREGEGRTAWCVGIVRWRLLADVRAR